MDTDEERIVTARAKDEDAAELSLRPKRLAEYIGQDKVKANLHILLDAAKGRREPLDHILLYGPPGLGKTTLATIVASEMGSNIRVTSGPAFERPGDVVSILTNLSEGDVLFVDEIHRLNRVIEETLYPAMEDFAVDFILGKGPSARTMRMALKRFTLVGATTRLGLISAPLRDRFGVHYNLEFYSQEALEEIVRRSALVLKMRIDDGGVAEVARRSRGTPRVANRLLKRVRDYAQMKADGLTTQAVAQEALAMLEVDPLGLDATDIRLLDTIIRKFGGGPVGLDTIAAATHEERDTVEDVYEPFLLQLGFLQRTPRGAGGHGARLRAPGPDAAATPGSAAAAGAVRQHPLTGGHRRCDRIPARSVPDRRPAGTVPSLGRGHASGAQRLQVLEHAGEDAPDAHDRLAVELRGARFGDAQARRDLLEGPVLPVAQPQDLALPLRHPLERLGEAPAQLGLVGAVRGVGALLVLQPLQQRERPALVVRRGQRIQREHLAATVGLGLHALRRRQPRGLGQFRRVGPAAQPLLHLQGGALDRAGAGAGGARQPVQLADLIDQEAADARQRVRLELHAPRGVEAIDCVDQPHGPVAVDVLGVHGRAGHGSQATHRMADERGVAQDQLLARRHVRGPRRLNCSGDAHVAPPRDLTHAPVAIVHRIWQYL